ncbi:outer membrane beta-barrel protein [Sphingomonas antarctica]|uniref:outer membrane beta-barrel protein n=1 Tax=Sphingomonas antarctica TaxID=2040274 RepID=UPI0039ED1C19
MAAVAFVPSAAVAQQAPTRQFSIEPQLRLEFDDNVLRLPDVAASPNGFRRSDTRASPQLAINIVRPIGRQSLFLTGVVGYDFYRYNKQLERERISLRGGGSVSAGTCTLNGDVRYSRRQSDLEDIVIGGFGRGRNRETSWAPDVGVSCGAAGGLSSSLNYGHDDVQNSDPFRSYGDYHADTYNAQIGLNRPAIGNLSLYTNYRHGIYDNRFLSPGLNESVKSYAAGVKLDREFGRIKGHVSGGVTRVQSNTPGVRGFRGGTYDVALTYVAPRATAEVGFGRSIQQSNLLGVDYSIVDSFNVGLTYRLNPRITLNSGAGVTRRRLSQSPLAPLPTGNFNDRSRTINVGASFDAARHVSLDAGAIWRQRRGDLPSFAYNARILALTIRIH